ncbi:hypothetical protein ANCDUO_05658 [Ancylostoma duodenale]|uniref:EGF-like domain-containing protein n=1 Tax=Ancylostoma duodenale TaxID=51022 RepID=A0A0C2H3M4_9BILA|nr:hypothetical protein ANCDUO_05658 [Ancylostoma duodenale]
MVLCGQNAECHNTIGGYECRCRKGFSGDGKECSRGFIFRLKYLFWISAIREFQQLNVVIPVLGGHVHRMGSVKNVPMARDAFVLVDSVVMDSAAPLSLPSIPPWRI